MVVLIIPNAIIPVTYFLQKKERIFYPLHSFYFFLAENMANIRRVSSHNAHQKAEKSYRDYSNKTPENSSQNLLAAIASCPVHNLP